MHRQLPFCARDVPREVWPPLLRGELRGADDLVPYERGEQLPDGCQLRDALPLHDDAWRHVHGDVLPCDGVLLLPWTYSLLLPTIFGPKRDCALVVKRT